MFSMMVRYNLRRSLLFSGTIDFRGESICFRGRARPLNGIQQITVPKSIRLIFIAIFAVTFCNVEKPPFEKEKELQMPLPEYTRENYREWENFAESHTPQIKKINHNTYEVLTGVMNQPGHYVEKIGIMDSLKKDIIVKDVSQIASGPVKVRFNLIEPLKKNDYKAYVKCNLHDLWVAPLSQESHPQ